MKRKRTWWFGGALLSVGAIACWLVAPPAGTPDVHLRFLHFTNSTDGLSSDELAVSQNLQVLPPRLPPPTHAVVQLTNGSGTEVGFIAMSVAGFPAGSVGGKRVASDSFFPGKLQGIKPLAPGETLTVEMKVMSSTGPWLADVRFIRFGRLYRAVRRINPYLPVSFRNWVGRRFLAIDSATLEFGDASSPIDAAGAP